MNNSNTDTKTSSTKDGAVKQGFMAKAWSATKQGVADHRAKISFIAGAALLYTAQAGVHAFREGKAGVQESNGS